MTSGWNGSPSDGPPPYPGGMIAAVRAYWEALRDGDSLPRRAQVDPRGIANALENTFLIERVAPGIARFRIAGLLYNDLMGMDIRGMPLSCLFLGPARDSLQTDLEHLFSTPAALSLTLVAERRLGRLPLRARLQILPMLDRSDACTLALGCIETLGEIGRVPCRFGIAEARLTPLGAAAASNAAPIAAPRPPRAVAGVPHLRLVKA
ncbi:PAS domain-containing protein [Pseudorhodobacter sp. MZDSW-24AT]|uniref:PAS domain-containing protein n=1 Tax=Pseudorhodobacter sp. MZDSW-24AT TaxID=2052957 RepID=UPI000C1E1453|nr:PAS domain-containing protein [Pseudorhodobacter sp. MZDSW-24AT]PJF10990.1 hypothetical protein CUR21_03345 [Pseudorhodobacter sp. MZDSW-24AT]